MSMNSVPMQPSVAYPYFLPPGAPQAAGSTLGASPVASLPAAAASAVPAIAGDQFSSSLTAVQQQAQQAIAQAPAASSSFGSVSATGAGIAQTAAPYMPGAIAGHHAARTLNHTYGNGVRRSSSGRSSYGRSSGYRTSSGRSSSRSYSNGRSGRSYSSGRSGGVTKVKGYTRWENGKLEHVSSHTTSASRMRTNSYGSRSYGSRSTGSRSAGRLRAASAPGSGLSAPSLFSDVVRGVRDSAIVNGVISVAINGYKLAKGQETKGTAAGNVTGDLMSGVVGGAAGAVTSAIGTSLLAGVLGSGLMLSVAGIGLGIGGYMIADHFLRKTTFFQNLTGSVQRMFGG